MLKTVYAKDLKSGMIIKCGFVVLENIKIETEYQEITFLTTNCRISVAIVGDMWDFEVFR